MNRREFLLAAGVAAATRAAGALPLRRVLKRAAPGEKPSQFSKILLIMCDQWRTQQHWPAVHLPAYQRLCRNGLEFTHACVATTACTPSRATLFSGKYGAETGAQLTSGLHVVFRDHETYAGASPDNPRCQLPKSVKTLGHHFSAAGIPAYYKGKWHLSHADGKWPKGPIEGIDAYGFKGWNPPEGHGKDAWRLGYGVDSSYVQDTVRLLWDLKNQGTESWFVVCSLINPHDIGAFPKWLMDIPDMGVAAPGNFRDDLQSKPACQRQFRSLWADGTLAGRALANRKAGRGRTQPQELWHEYLQLYAFLVQMADSQVGIVLDTLEDTEQRDDTLVVFLSDHGEQGGGHGMMQKWYQAYEESIRVPLVFSNPRLFPQARRSGGLASLVDVAPTLLSMAGLELPGGRDTLRGKDLSPVVLGQKESVQDEVLFVSDDDIAAVSPYKQWTGPVSQPNRVRCLRNSRHKLVRYVAPDNSTAAEYELYDLSADPLEMRNLAREGSSRGLLDELNGRLDQLLADRYQLPPLY